MPEMDVKTRAALCVLPIGCAVAVVFTLALPAWDEYSTKSKAVEDKKTEQHDLEVKLADRVKIQREKKTLDTDIEDLRNAVPKQPEIEILNLDMEKMCLDSGLELVSFKEADTETLKKAGMQSEASAGSSLTKGKQALADRVTKTAATATAASSAVSGTAGKPGAKDAKGGGGADAGLSKITMQVKCMGDYTAMEKLVRKLETYRRVVAITEVKTYLPKHEDHQKKTAVAELPDDAPPTEDDAQGDWRRLWVTFLLTAYYLP